MRNESTAFDGWWFKIPSDKLPPREADHLTHTAAWIAERVINDVVSTRKTEDMLHGDDEHLRLRALHMTLNWAQNFASMVHGLARSNLRAAEIEYQQHRQEIDSDA